jgi:hypothetical protein
MVNFNGTVNVFSALQKCLIQYEEEERRPKAFRHFTFPLRPWFNKGWISINKMYLETLRINLTQHELTQMIIMVSNLTFPRSCWCGRCFDRTI